MWARGNGSWFCTGVCLFNSPHIVIHCYIVSLASAANPAANLSTCYTSFLPQVRSKPINTLFAHFQLRVLLPRRASSSCDAQYREGHTPCCASTRRSCSSMSLRNRHCISIECHCDSGTSHFASHGYSS